MSLSSLKKSISDKAQKTKSAVTTTAKKVSGTVTSTAKKVATTITSTAAKASSTVHAAAAAATSTIRAGEVVVKKAAGNAVHTVISIASSNKGNSKNSVLPTTTGKDPSKPMSSTATTMSLVAGTKVSLEQARKNSYDPSIVDPNYKPPASSTGPAGKLPQAKQTGLNVLVDAAKKAAGLVLGTGGAVVGTAVNVATGVAGTVVDAVTPDQWQNSVSESSTSDGRTSTSVDTERDVTYMVQTKDATPSSGQSGLLWYIVAFGVAAYVLSDDY